MSYPNSALSAWEMAVIAVVAVGTLAVWLIAVYLADRQPARSAGAAAGTGPAEEPAGQAADSGQQIAA